MGGREIQEGGNLCIHIANLLCCTAKTNTALQSNYIPIFFQITTKMNMAIT